MRWLDFAVCPKFSWPNVQVEIPFEGYNVVLQPLRQGYKGMELACTVSVFDPDGITFEVGCTVASRFLSRLAWSQAGGVIELWPSGSNQPEGPGRLGQGTYERSGWVQVAPWESLYLPAADDDDAGLALGLYREGMSLNSTPFTFLSYFKILNILHGGGAAQKQWINKNLENITYGPAVERLTALRELKPDVGKYLYEEGRCAVAHAHGDPLVNPDSYADKRRMENDIRLMKEIAKLLIERELGILTDFSYWQSLRHGKEAGAELLRKTVDEEGQVRYVPEQASACTMAPADR